MYSGAKLLMAYASLAVALSRTSDVLKLRSPPSYPQLANNIRCSLRESGHGNVTSDYADAASQKWQPSNFAFVQEEYRSKPILSSKDERAAEKSTKLGLSEEMVREISKRNNEPEWMLRFRLDAFRQMLAMAEPPGAKCPPIDFRTMPSDSSRLHQMQVSQELVDDASGESFATTNREVLAQAGVIFCSIAEAIRDHPELVRKYLGRVVAPSDNFYAALNSAVFRDGSFCYVSENVTCPMDISTHFLVAGRKTTSPFDRTLIVCAEHASVTSLGCTSPAPEHPESDHPHGPHLHAPVIELFCAAGSEIKHVTVQNWLETGATSPAHEQEAELLCNYVTQRGLCDGARSQITWAIVEAGSGVTWQHPALVLKGEGSVGECFSATLTTARQQADTGATMIHRGSHTRSRIVANTIAAGSSHSTFRGIVHVEPWSRNASSEAQWDAILIGDHAQATSCPSVVVRNTSAQVQERGSTSRVNREQVFLFQQRGVSAEKAVPAILTGFCDAVLRELPHEFESEVREMVALKIEEFLEGSPFG